MALSEIIAPVQISGTSLDELLSKEWLLTNNRGGYASSSILGCNTRRYHGLLIGSLTPPVNRITALSNCFEMLTQNGQNINLSTFEFNDEVHPQGFKYLKCFRRDIGAHFDYDTGGVELTKSVYLLRDTDTVAVVYNFINTKSPAEFILRPLISLRDFHSLQKSYAPLRLESRENCLVIRNSRNGDMDCELAITCPAMPFEKDPQWWYNFEYRVDKERGQEFNEDLWSPGIFKLMIDSPTKIILWASISENANLRELTNYDIDSVCKNLERHQADITAKAEDENLRLLYLAADQFITKRTIGTESLNNPAPAERTTILAGYPWFADWGRDTFISLPGLLLSTKRFDEAKSVLITFAHAVDQGMVPNRFDDRSATAYFNSIDASLWFIHAAFEYLNTAGDSETFIWQLLPVIKTIMEYYQNGTRFGIHADSDGLITAGSIETQLTWMDAKFGGVAFTPRYGKAVEINALWYNSLCSLADFYSPHDATTAHYYKIMADKVKTGFCQAFWNEKIGCLNDCVFPNGSVDASLRPNQIFAVSLKHSPLPPHQQKSVVEIVQRELLTPYGLRTLNKNSSRYKAIYTGPQQYRDEAYHQGTAWPFLIGPFVQAYLKVNNFSKESKTQGRKFLNPLLHHLTSDGCLASVSEIFDADPPHKPRGCFAQAWSVAELLRAYYLTEQT